MTQAQHTQRPWFVNESRMTVEAIDPVYGNGIVIAKPNTQADANLIAAAPDLLQSNISALHALSQAKSVLYHAYAKEGGDMPHRIAAIQLIERTEDELRSAIAKARGEA